MSETGTFGERLRSRRKKAKLTQAEAAGRAGIGQGHWSDIEAGRASPTLDTLSKITAAIGCSLKTLV